MYSPKTKLESPDDFSFPFNPYEIQQNLMQTLYKVIENKEIGIFESPTGTGKSLTLTCGALKWLSDHEKLVRTEIVRRIAELNDEIKKLEVIGSKTDDWIETQFDTIQRKDEVSSLKKLRNIMEEHEKKLLDIKERVKEKLKDRKQKNNLHVSTTRPPEETFSMEDISFEDIDDEINCNEDNDREEQFKDVKIYFCSRTHSQLTQVVQEVKKTVYGEEIRCVSLASRHILCINPLVKSMSSSSFVNERCLDMQKGQSATSCDNDNNPKKKIKLKQITCCPYKNKTLISELSGTALVEILDIEDMVDTGEYMKACPYYSAREAAKDAQLIMLPYQMLLHKRTRLQTGIDLRNSVVIVDEAHNLIDTISNIYSSQISLYQLQTALNQLTTYKTKYFNRFGTKYLLKTNQLIFITKRLVKLLSSCEIKSRMIKTHELMSEGEFFNIDIFQILTFCEKTRFAQKVHGLAQKIKLEKNEKENAEAMSTTTLLLKKMEGQASDKQNASNSRAKAEIIDEADKKLNKNNHFNAVPLVIRPLLSFLESLTESVDDGMVLLSSDKDVKKAYMKFVLLNPGNKFSEIVEQCRSVIIAGGTMQPVWELTDQLLKRYSERVRLHFYDHVISPQSVLPFAVEKGPSGKKLLFNFANRNSEEMLNELGMILSNVCSAVHGGVICFFASYDYLDVVFTYLKNKGILSRIEMKKRVFCEPRSSDDGTTVETLLAQYTSAIRSHQQRGALLFSVVSGKLSEGLNFSDDLGRCIIVVGLPYPNRNSPELQEKMKYLDAFIGMGAGSEYYNNLCMKAVNQCIGRSVRHINDFACVLLLDERYILDRINKKLSAWISKSLRKAVNFGLVQKEIAKFFREKQ